MRRSILFLLALSLPACKESITPPEHIPGQCEGGATHAGDISAETWRRSNNPHLVTADVGVLGTLTIEPGVVVCFASDAGLVAKTSEMPGGKIIARGTQASPITFSGQANAGWEGIRIGGDYGGRDTSVFTHVLVENATFGISAWATVLVDSSRFRQIGGTAISTNNYGANSRITNTVIDSSGSITTPAVRLGGGTFENNTVRASRGDGILLDGRFATTTIGGGRVEGSEGVGIIGSIGGYSAHGSAPIRITEGKKHAVEAGLWLIDELWQGAELDSLRGNARDTIVLIEGAHTFEYRLSARFPWRLKLYDPYFGGSKLVLEPGASLTGSGVFSGILIAEGTQSAPVRLTGNFTFLGPQTSRLRHVTVSGSIYNYDQQLTVDSSHFAPGSAFYSRAPGTVIRHTIFEAPKTLGLVHGLFPYTANAGVVLAGEGSSFSNSFIRNTSDAGLSIEAALIHVDSSVFNGNTGTAIRTTVSDGVSITRSNFSGNGIAVSNLTTIPLDAKMNWWGNSTAPNTPQAERVLGPVEVVPFSTASFIIAEP